MFPFSCCGNGISLPGKDEDGRSIQAQSISGRERMSVVSLATVVLTIFLLTIYPASTRAQAVWGGINGYVTDSTGAVIPQATVVVTDEQTGVETKVVTDAAGFYDVTHLNPSQYSVSVNVTGFKGFKREHLILTVASTIRVDCALQTGSAEQTITVNAAPPILNTEQTDVNQRFDAATLESLPLTGNNITQLYSLVPGVLPDTFQMGTGENPQGTNRTYVNGVGLEPRFTFWMA